MGARETLRYQIDQEQGIRHTAPKHIRHADPSNIYVYRNQTTKFSGREDKKSKPVKFVMGDNAPPLCWWAHTDPMRLLVERTGKATGEGARDIINWVNEFYRGGDHEDAVKARCWKEAFLLLNLLTDEDLLKIMDSFGAYLRKKKQSTCLLPTEAERAALLERLKAVDRELSRPLYALFLTGVLMAGDDPTRWEKKWVLDYIIDRENIRLDERLRLLGLLLSLVGGFLCHFFLLF